MEEAIGLLTNRPDPEEISEILSQDLDADWKYSMGLWDEVYYSDGFLVVQRSVYSKDKNFLFQVGIIREFLHRKVFHIIYSCVMLKGHCYTDYFVECTVFMERTTKIKAFEVRVIVPHESGRHFIKQYAPTTKILNFKGIRNLLSSIMPPL